MESKILLDIGCGLRKTIREGWECIGIDSRSFDGVDIVANIGKDKFPLEDNSVDEIRSIHVFEHLYPEELFFCMEECFRVIKPSGLLHIEVPKAGTPAYFIHPDHKIQFMEDTFGFFHVPHQGKDPHGYMKGFWHVNIIKEGTYEQHIKVDMFPNKEGGRFPFVEVKFHAG